MRWLLALLLAACGSTVVDDSEEHGPDLVAAPVLRVSEPPKSVDAKPPTTWDGNCECSLDAACAPLDGDGVCGSGRCCRCEDLTECVPFGSAGLCCSLDL